MHVSNLQNEPHRLEECLNLIEKSFEYEQDYHFSQDFNLLVHESNYKNCYFVEENDQVLATVFTLPRVFTYKDSFNLPVLFIGGISVDPESQGQGLFRSLIETVLSLNSDYGLYLLWSDLSSLYEKFRFFEFGLIEEVTPTNQEHELVNLSQESFNLLKSNYQDLTKNYILPTRSPLDWDLLWQNSSISKLTDNLGNSYFLNKGMDLQGVIHESYLSDNTENKTTFPIWKYDPAEDSTAISRYMGFMRIGNIELLSNFIKDISNEDIFIERQKDDSLLLIVNFLGDNYEMTEKDFLQGLWGPGRIEEWTQLIPNLIIFGFDSI